MSPFAIHDPYVEPKELGSVENDDECQLDSDLSDADAQELADVYKQLDPRAVPRDLAPATLHLQGVNWDKWSAYCKFIHKKPLELLKRHDAKLFMLYFVWYQKKYERARSLYTFEHLWKSLRQLYYDKIKHKIPKAVGKQITNYLHRYFCEKYQLSQGMRQKYEVGHNTLLKILHYH